MQGRHGREGGPKQPPPLARPRDTASHARPSPPPPPPPPPQGAFWGGAAARRAVSAGRFLVLDLSLNESALHAGHAEADAPPGHYTWQDNYYFVQHQLRQFRAALALARATRRTLVLPRFAVRAGCSPPRGSRSQSVLFVAQVSFLPPPFPNSQPPPPAQVLCQCFFYRPEGCVISGLRVRLPHVAPTAHVLRVDRLAAEPVAPPTALDDAPARWRHPRAATPAARLAAAAASAGGDGGGAGAAAAGLAARRVVRLDGGDLLAAAAAGVVDTSAVSDSMLGAWCCVKATDYPEFAAASGLTGDADARVRYGFDGPPRMVPAASPDVGKCSV